MENTSKFKEIIDDKKKIINIGGVAQIERLACERCRDRYPALVHRFNNRWRWCRFASSIFKTMPDDMHKLKFQQFYSFIRFKIVFFMFWVLNFQ